MAERGDDDDRAATGETAPTAPPPPRTTSNPAPPSTAIPNTGATSNPAPALTATPTSTGKPSPTAAATPSAWGLVLTAFALYAVLMLPLYSDNENRSRALMESLYARRSVTIDVARFKTRDVSVDAGQPRCGGAPGVAWVGLAGYVPVRLVADRLTDDVTSELAGYIAAILVAAALPAALAVAALARFARGLESDGATADEAARLVAFGSLLLPYASIFMSHALTIGALAGALLLVERALRGPDAGRRAALAGLLAGVATTAEYPAALAALVLGVLLLTRREGRGARALGYAAGVAPPLGLLLVYQWVAFGHPLHTPYGASADPETRRICATGFLGYGLPTVESVVGVSVSPQAGLLLYAPAVVIGLMGAFVALRRGDAIARVVAGACALLDAAYFALNTARVQDWAVGWCVGPRYLLVALPFALAFARLGLATLPRAARAAFVGWCGLVSWIEAQATIHYLPGLESLGQVARAGPRVGWALLLQRPTGPLSAPLTTLLAAALLVVWSAATFCVWRRRDPHLARVGLGIGAATLAHLALARP